MDNQLSVVPDQGSFGMPANFEHAQRVAKALSAADIVPAAYKNNIPNTMIALEMANRIGVSPLMIMQHLNIIQGKPSFSSTFLISAINTCGRFEPLRFMVEGEGEALKCTAWTVNKKTNERVESPEVTYEMAKSEGWTTKGGSKWKSMPKLMIQYRAAAFFSRLHCPEITMGMQTAEEIFDAGTQVHDFDSDFVELVQLYELKEDQMSEEEKDNANRIINTKETASYSKLKKLLQDK